MTVPHLASRLFPSAATRPTLGPLQAWNRVQAMSFCREVQLCLPHDKVQNSDCSVGLISMISCLLFPIPYSPLHASPYLFVV